VSRSNLGGVDNGILRHHGAARRAASSTLTSQDRIEEHLRKHAGAAFCAACVADEVGVSATLGRAIVWMLLALPDYQMIEGECASCLRVKRVVRYVAATASCAGAPRT
jgi:uncharacterized membrane protein